MKKLNILLFVSFFIASFASAPLNAQDGYAGMPGTFLQMGVGARAMSMGNAFTALAKDATALYWNPAGIANQDPYQIYFMHSALFMSTNFDYMAATAPTRRYGNFGLGVIALTSGDFDQRNELNEPLGKFGMTDMAFLFSWAKEMYAGVSVGVNYKLVSQKMLDYSGIGHGIDVGFRRNFLDWLSTGITFSNLLSPQVTMGREAEKFPMQLRVGAAATLLDDKLIVSADISKISGWGKTRFNTGAEYEVMHGLSLRAGLNYDQFTMGVGFSFDKIGLDYSNHNVPDMGMSHLFAVSYAFGGFGVGAQAFPNVFSPAGEQNISKIKLHVKSRGEVENWNFTILDKDGNTIRNFVQSGNLPEQIVWDGRDDNGDLVADGSFDYRFEVVTSQGKSYSSSGSLVSIYTKGPSGSLGVITEK